MDINTRDGYGTKQPRGSATTVLDLVDRDDQDNNLFPLKASISRFVRDDSLRTIPYSSVLREFTFKGPTDLGQRFTFELSDIACGDLIQGLFIQIKMPDWFTGVVRQRLQAGSIQYSDPSQAWTYVNSLGTSILDVATLEVDDQVLERITGDSVAAVSRIFPDLNTAIGVADVEGRKSMADMLAWDGTRILPTEDGWITVPLLFSMLRERLRATFPLISCRSGTIRVNVTLKRFDQLVRSITGQRASCDDTPLGKIVAFTNDMPDQKTPLYPPGLLTIQLLTYGLFVDGPYRQMLLRQPFERPFREIQQFDFTEPLKYIINKSGNDTVQIQLQLEANQPVEEIVWFLRLKDTNNNWTNYSATLEKDYDPVFAPLQPLMTHAKIQGNGMDIVSQDEAWYRSHIARAHRGGRAAYDSYLYGYSFAKNPGEHDPTGSINASRLNSLRLTLDVKVPKSGAEWEVHVFVFAFQWLRFENGICTKVFID